MQPVVAAVLNGDVDLLLRDAIEYELRPAALALRDRQGGRGETSRLNPPRYFLCRVVRGSGLTLLYNHRPP